MEIIIDANNLTLANVLKSKFPLITRSQIKKLIDKRYISSNQISKLKDSTKLTIGETLFLHIDAIRSYILELKQLTTSPTSLQIIHEDSDIIAIDKPSGLLTHGGTGSLVELVQSYCIQTASDPFLVVNPIHRLDKDTSGIILFAKTPDAIQFYSKQFKSRNVQKSYVAKVLENFSIYLKKKRVEKVDIANFISRKPKDRKYFLTDSIHGDLAQTSFSLYENKNPFLILAEPKTGRTHQIRVHLSHLGFPIVGDTLYEGTSAERLFLHAFEIQVPSMHSEKILKFTAPIPSEFFD